MEPELNQEEQNNMAEKTIYGSGLLVVTDPNAQDFPFISLAEEFSYNTDVTLVDVQGNGNYAYTSYDGKKSLKGKFKLAAFDNKFNASIDGAVATGSIEVLRYYTLNSTSGTVSPTGTGMVARGARDATGAKLDLTGSAPALGAYTFATGSGAVTVNASEDLPVEVVYSFQSGTSAYNDAIQDMGSKRRFVIRHCTRTTAEDGQFHGEKFTNVAINKKSVTYKNDAIVSYEYEFEAYPDANGIVYTSF
jgi:hypothetical protein